MQASSGPSQSLQMPLIIMVSINRSPSDQQQMAERLNYSSDLPEQTIPSSTNMSWGSSAIIASVFFILGQYLLRQSRLAHWEAMALSSLGVLLLCLFLIVYSWCYMYYRTGIFPGIYHSTLVKTSWAHGKFKFKASKGIAQSLAAGLCNNLAFFVMFGFLRLANYEGTGFVAVIVVFVAMACALLNYWLFNQQYTLVQGAGILMITVGAQVYNSHWSYSEYVYSVTCGVLCLALFCARGTMNKWASALEFDGYTGGLLGCLSDSALGLIEWGILYLGGYLGEYIPMDFAVSLGAGCCLGLGSFCLTYSIMVGNSGVGFALTVIQVLVMADIGIDGLNAEEMAVFVVSLVLCVAGLIVAIFGDHLCKLMNCRMNYTFNEKPKVLQERLLEMDRYADN